MGAADTRVCSGTSLDTRRAVGTVLGVGVNAISWEGVLDRVLAWARDGESRSIAVCNAHVVTTAARDVVFGEAIRGADLAVPDGAPVAWMLRRLGFADQRRISGPDLMVKLFERCAREGLSVYFYGSTAEVLHKLRTQLERDFPALRIAGAESPPFRQLTRGEERAAVTRINDSGAGIVFVGLGCPKQELWMMRHRRQVRGVMIGVGAAFEFYAGTVKRAPGWMQRAGLEWLHRLVSEPRRLWKRYLVTNTLFVWGAFLQLTRMRLAVGVRPEQARRLALSAILPFSGRLGVAKRPAEE